MRKPAENDKKEEGTAGEKAGQPVHPFLLHSAAAFAAATAVGIGIQTQIAGAMLGLFEGAIGAGRRGAAEPAGDAPEPAAAPQAAPADVPAPSPVPVAATVTKPKPKTPAREKSAVAKSKPRTAPVRAKAVRDDLKRISGIGPKLEQVLNGKGIFRFADIAAWSEADAKRIDAELGTDGRIGRDDWVGQAKALSGSLKNRNKRSAAGA